MTKQWIVTYEACIENLKEYDNGNRDISGLDSSDIDDISGLYSSMDDDPFWFSIKKWKYNEYEDVDSEYHHLCNDGTFSPSLPKYVMKKLQPHIEHIINHKNFR